MKFAERKKRPSYGIAVLSLFLILVLTACGSGSSYQAASPSAEAKASYDGEAYADNYAAAEAAYDTADARRMQPEVPKRDPTVKRTQRSPLNQNRSSSIHAAWRFRRSLLQRQRRRSMR